MVSVRHGGLASLLLVASGCFVDVTFGDRPYLCMTDPMECDDGFECRGGRCVAIGTPFDAAPDVGVDAAVAPNLPTFLAPVLVGELNEVMADDDDASYTADRLHVVFSSDRGVDDDLFTSSRTSVDGPWDPPELVTELSGVGRETGVALSADGLTVLFASDRAGGLGGLDIYMATRASVDEAWEPPVEVASVNSVADDLPGFLAPDGQLMLLHSNRAGNQDLFTAERAGLDWAPPEPISSVNTADGENSGRFARGGLVLTFHSNRATGLGRADLYAATRATLDDPFSPAELIGTVNSDLGEQDAWLSEDLCTLSMVRSDADGFQQILEATCVP